MIKQRMNNLKSIPGLSFLKACVITNIVLLAASSQAEILTPTVVWDIYPNPLTVNTPVRILSAHVESEDAWIHLPVTYMVATPDVCEVKNNQVDLLDADKGSCIVSATTPGNEQYESSTSTISISTAKVSPVIGINIGETVIMVGGSVETGGTGEEILTYSVSGPCTSELGQYTPPSLTVTGVSTGVCVVTYNYPGDGLYEAWSTTRDIEVLQQYQTLEISEIPEFAQKEVDFQVYAEATSGLPVSIVASGNCTKIDNNTIRPLNPGVCNLTFSQAGNANYHPAETETATVIVTGPQIITPSVPPSGQYEAVVTTSATASSGLPVQISVDENFCQLESEDGEGYALSTAQVKLSAIGQCTITYRQPGGEVNGVWFAAAPTVTRKITIARLTQYIQIENPQPPQTKQAGTTVEVTALAYPLPDPAKGEGARPVVITTAPNSACEIQDSEGDWALVLLHEEGTYCTIYFNQPGDSKYGPAQQLDRSITLSQVTDGEDIDQYWKAKKLFTTGVDSSTRQPIMSPPMLARNGDVKAPWPNVMVIFGTGKYHEAKDIPDKSVQSIYGIHDRGIYNNDLARYKTFNNKPALAKRVFTEVEITLANNQGSQLSRKVSGDEVDWSKQFGWYVDLASDLNNNGVIDANEKLGERSVFRPFLANRLYVFNTVQPVSMSCDGATKGWTMLIDWTSGLAPDFPTYDVNMDGSFNDSDKGFIGYFNDTAASELGRGGDSIYDTSGSDARRRQVTFGVGETGTRLGWEEKQPFGVLKRN